MKRSDSSNKKEPAGSRGATIRDVFSVTFIGISLINFIVMTSYYATFVVMTSFLMETYGSSAGFAGLAAGIVVIGCFVGRFFTGRIVHSQGYKRILVSGVILYFLTNFAYTVIGGDTAYLIDRFISGAAFGIIGTATGTMVALITPRQFLGRGISYFSMSTAFALCIGPFIGIAFAPVLTYEGVFVLCAVLSAVSAAIAVLIPVSLEKRKAEKKPLAIRDFIEPGVIPFSLLVAVFCLAWGCIQAFLAPYAKETGFESASSFFFLVYAAAILASRPVTGKIYDLHGPSPVFYPAMASLAAGLVLLWGAWGSWCVYAAGALLGFGFGNIQSVGQSTAVAMVPRQRFAQATSTFYIFFDLGVGSAPYFFGLMQQDLGYRGIFGINAVAATAGIVLYWMLRHYHGRRPSMGEPVPVGRSREAGA